MVGIRRTLITLAACFGALAPVIAATQKPDAGEASSLSNDAVPPDFRGTITYSGTHEGELRSARSTRQYAGAYNLELTFDGNALSGRAWGTGGISSATLTGTRSGSRCRLIDERYGVVTEAQCTRGRFSGTARTQPGPRPQMVMHIEAEATSPVEGQAAESHNSQLSPRILVTSPQIVRRVQRILTLNEQIRSDMQTIRNRCTITQAEYDEWFRIFQRLDDFREITDVNLEQWVTIADEASRVSGEVASRSIERRQRGIQVCG